MANNHLSLFQGKTWQYKEEKEKTMVYVCEYLKNEYLSRIIPGLSEIAEKLEKSDLLEGLQVVNDAQDESVMFLLESIASVNDNERR